MVDYLIWFCLCSIALSVVVTAIMVIASRDDGRGI